MAVAHCRLAVDGYAVIDISIVDACIDKSVAHGGIPAVQTLCVGLQTTVETCVDGRCSEVESAAFPVDIAADGGLVGIVFLPEFRCRAVVARRDDGPDVAEGVECSIDRAVGDESRGVETLTNAHRCRRSLHVFCRRPRRVGPYAVGAAAEAAERHHLPETKVVVHHQAHSHAQFILSHGQRFQSSEPSHDEIPDIVVIAHAVLVGEERLAGILRALDSRLDILAVGELIAYSMAVFRTTIFTCFVAFTVIERNIAGGRKLISPVADDVGKVWEVLLSAVVAYIYKIGKEVAACGVEALDHRQFTDALHALVLIDVGLDVLNLLGREKWYAPEVVPCCRIDVYGVLLEVDEDVVHIRRDGYVVVVLGCQLLEQSLPWALTLGRDGGAGQKEE